MGRQVKGHCRGFRRVLVKQFGKGGGERFRGWVAIKERNEATIGEGRLTTTANGFLTVGTKKQSKCQEVSRKKHRGGRPLKTKDRGGGWCHTDKEPFPGKLGTKQKRRRHSKLLQCKRETGAKIGKKHASKKKKREFGARKGTFHQNNWIPG